MKISLFSNVILSMMVAHLFASITFGVIMLISIPLYCTFFGGYIFTLGIFPFFVYVYVATCPSTKYCSTPSSSDLWMHIGSTSVAPRPLYSFELQPFFRLCKNSIIDVLDLYISWIMEYTNYIFSWYYFPSSHSKDDSECDDNFTLNGWLSKYFLNVLVTTF